MLRRLFLTPLLAVGCIAVPMNAATPPGAGVERGFIETVQPFLSSYCTSCHSGAKPAAQLDLRQYSTTASVVQDFSRWNRVLARLAAKEMPPKAMKQPPDEARQQVIDWIQATWTNEARKHDGDPGVVLARRLSNSEYNYTIRDLTGVELRPGCGDVETPVAGKPRERRLDKAKRRGLAPGRDVAHGKLRLRLCRPSRRTSLARRSDHITYWILLCFLADCAPPRNTGIKDSGKPLVPQERLRRRG